MLGPVGRRSVVRLNIHGNSERVANGLHRLVSEKGVVVWKITIHNDAETLLEL